MRILVKSRGVEMDAETRADIERRVSMILGRFANAIARLRVVVTDQNGAKGGVDMRAVVTMEGRTGLSITVEDTDVTPREAVSSGLRRARKAFLRHTRRQRDVRRRPLALDGS